MEVAYKSKYNNDNVKRSFTEHGLLNSPNKVGTSATFRGSEAKIDE